ncbi:MAG: hypothetical protein ABIR34_13490 [Marmoricola sp.]
MGNVTLPTPVFMAGGALCLLAGYLVGSVVGTDAPVRTTGQVVSFTSSTSRLCLNGDAITDQEGVDADGELCGTLRRTPNAELPRKGDDFRFVSVRTSGVVNGKTHQQIVIYGDVVN